MQTITLKNSQLKVLISTRGAEPLSITDSKQRERLWCGDPSVWGFHAPLLFPVAGAFTDDFFIHKGQRYEMKRHGFARTSLFAIEEQQQDRLVLSLSEPMPNYPFEYCLQVTYTLRENALQIEYAVENKGKGPLYFGIGSHEAYACPGGLNRYEIVFDQPERLEAHEMIGAQVGNAKRLYAENSDTLSLDEGMFDCDTLVFMSLKSRSLTLRDKQDEGNVRIDFGGMDYLLLWTKPGAPFLCIEPWCNPPEPLGFNHELEQKPGILCVSPQETVRRAHTLTFEA